MVQRRFRWAIRRLGTTMTLHSFQCLACVSETPGYVLVRPCTGMVTSRTTDARCAESSPGIDARRRLSWSFRGAFVELSVNRSLFDS